MWAGIQKIENVWQNSDSQTNIYMNHLRILLKTFWLCIFHKLSCDVGAALQRPHYE